MDFVFSNGTTNFHMKSRMIYYKTPELRFSAALVGKTAASICGELSDFPGAVKVVHLLSHPDPYLFVDNSAKSTHVSSPTFP
jgi:hypothetical protein